MTPIYAQSDLSAFVKKYTEIFILVDEHTFTYCYPLLEDVFNSHYVIKVHSGEEYKNIETFSIIVNELLEKKATRQALFINLGGGVITDLGGFVSSSYKRGIDFINIPTTLLAMVDAAIGGKTALDLQLYKNCIGSYYWPQAIFMNPDFLDTLPIRHIKSGLAEMLKHGLIASYDHWNQLKSISELTEIKKHISHSAQIKSNIVEQDPNEKSIRKMLNFGHTIGHAIESVSLLSAKPLLHGEAIAIGMYLETKISHIYSQLSLDMLNEIEKVLHLHFGELIYTTFPLNDLWKYMLNDKKNDSNSVNFTLLTEIGNAEINYQLSYQEIEKALA
ncbi:MAG: 3-dehydroquinate synthase [Bacteroidota bacterium]|jgi:3-dehydroquinate synthase